MTLSSFGIDCDACKFKIESGCSGCHTLKGKPFWADDDACGLYTCAYDKKLHDCGKCESFPCQMLEEWANSEEDENGQRIKNLKAQKSSSS